MPSVTCPNHSKYLHFLFLMDIIVVLQPYTFLKVFFFHYFGHHGRPASQTLKKKNFKDKEKIFKHLCFIKQINLIKYNVENRALRFLPLQ